MNYKYLLIAISIIAIAAIVYAIKAQKRLNEAYQQGKNTYCNGKGCVVNPNPFSSGICKNMQVALEMGCL